MKFSLNCFFCLLIISNPVFCETVPRLILYFDINKTLIASDKVTNKSVDNVINELLAEKYVGNWYQSLVVPISYSDYASRMTHSKKEKSDMEHGFMDYLKEQDHPHFKAAFQDYENAMAVLENSQGIVFPSFYSLLSYLDAEKISYSFILRSFGHEVMEVKEEIENVKNLEFEFTGKFLNESLVLQNGNSVKDLSIIYQLLKNINHAAIQDDWELWSANGEASLQGKPFYIDLSDVEVLPIFFDDNIRETNSYKNIVAPLDVTTGKLIPIDGLVESGQAVRVDTLDAILDCDYFIKLVKAALSKVPICR